MRRLEEIEARAKAATPGPWHVINSYMGKGVDSETVPQAVVAVFRHNEDQAFVAAAREDVPWLCEKLREAVALLERQRQHDAAGDANPDAKQPPRPPRPPR